jgi:hypothetical protein
LLGWVSGVTTLTTVLPGLPPMMPRTGLALLLIGGAAAGTPTGHLRIPVETADPAGHHRRARDRCGTDR